MWILKADKKQEILNQIDARLPEMLQQSGIHISTASTIELSNMIKANIIRHYFPTKGHDLARCFMGIMFFPLAIIDMMMQQLVAISENHTNTELRALTSDQKKMLEHTLNYQLITNYRDLEHEARAVAESRASSAARVPSPRPQVT